jgi:hypothetical protein
MVLGLRQATEVARKALEAEKKKVEGELPFACLLLVGSTCLGSAPNFCFSFMVFRPADRPGNSTTPTQAVQTAYNSSQHELEELWAAALEACQEVEESEAQAGSSMASRLRALGGHVTQRMRRTLHLGV